MIINITEYLSNALLDVFNMDLSYFETTVPVTHEIVNIIIGVGWALMLGNLAFQAIKSMATGLGFEGEDPHTLFMRTFAMSFLLFGSRQICDIGLGMTKQIIEMLQVPTIVQLPQFTEATFSVPGDASWLLCIIVGIILVVQIIKLFFEIGERYVVVAVLTILSPLAFGMGGSKNTADIFKGWCRMFGSMCLMMVLSVVFLKLILSAMSIVPTGVAVIPWLILVVAIARIGRKIDGIVARIGLNPAMTGDPLTHSRMPGMLTTMVMRNMTSSIGKAAAANKAGEAKTATGGRPSPSGPTPLPSAGTASKGGTTGGTAGGTIGGTATHPSIGTSPKDVSTPTTPTSSGHSMMPAGHETSSHKSSDHSALGDMGGSMSSDKESRPASFGETSTSGGTSHTGSSATGSKKDKSSSMSSDKPHRPPIGTSAAASKGIEARSSSTKDSGAHSSPTALSSKPALERPTSPSALSTTGKTSSSASPTAGKPSTPSDVSAAGKPSSPSDVSMAGKPLISPTGGKPSSSIAGKLPSPSASPTTGKTSTPSDVTKVGKPSSPVASPIAGKLSSPSAISTVSKGSVSTPLATSIPSSGSSHDGSKSHKDTSSDTPKPTRPPIGVMGTSSAVKTDGGTNKTSAPIARPTDSSVQSKSGDVNQKGGNVSQSHSSSTNIAVHQKALPAKATHPAGTASKPEHSRPPIGKATIPLNKASSKGEHSSHSDTSPKINGVSEASKNTSSPTEASHTAQGKSLPSVATSAGATKATRPGQTASTSNTVANKTTGQSIKTAESKVSSNNVGATNTTLAQSGTSVSRPSTVSQSSTGNSTASRPVSSNPPSVKTEINKPESKPPTPSKPINRVTPSNSSKGDGEANKR